MTNHDLEEYVTEDDDSDKENKEEEFSVFHLNTGLYENFSDIKKIRDVL
jgi:hypothetical protein